jgi:nucleoside-diphosphate-sugar epimerase
VAYAWSKAASERAAWRLAAQQGVALTTLRPHTVYGAFDEHSFTPWMKRLMAWPVAPWPTHLALPPVYAGDVAEAVCLALERPAARGRAYNVTGEADRHTYWDLMEAWRAAGGRAPRVVVPVPVPMRRRYAVERAHAELGWRNRPLVEGFREMLALEAAGGG